MRKFGLVVVALAALTLGGCGGGGSDDKGVQEEAAAGSGGVPKCSEIWKVGKTLNINNYDGCEDGDTTIVGVTSGCYDAESNYVGQFANYKKQLWVVQKGTDDQTGQGGTPGKVVDVEPQC